MIVAVGNQPSVAWLPWLFGCNGAKYARWSPNTTMIDIIDKLKSMFNKHDKFFFFPESLERDIYVLKKFNLINVLQRFGGIYFNHA